MDGILEPLSRDSIWGRLSNGTRHWVRDLQIHQEIDSTNSHLMRRSAVDIDGVVCFAETQTGGRGRRGRTWLTATGRGIALSLGRRMEMPIADLAPLSLVVGMAVADALDRSQISPISLKWPNDVLLNGAKVGGILIEIANASDPCVVIGVGINVGAGCELSSQLGFGVGDALASNHRVSRNALAAELVNSIVDFAAAFESRGFAPMQEAWHLLHAHQDQCVELRCANETVRGIARGVTSSGEFKLETTTGIRCFNVGEISLRTTDRVR
jgi:BirA family transcriptional regulator, biotin operon repressor / biotin---[acetyl-CoA-carboxylase] ligase